MLGLVSALLLVISMDSFAASKDETILNGVKAGGKDISKMTLDEAKQAVSDYVNTLLSKTLTVKTGENKTEVAVSDFNISCDYEEVADEAFEIGRNGNIVTRYKTIQKLNSDGIIIPISFKADDEAVSSIVKSQADSFNVEPVDMSLTRQNGEFVINEGKEGIVVKEDASKELVSKFFESSFSDGESVIELDYEAEAPKGDRKQLEKVHDLLGSFSTNCGSGARVTNIANGASLINGSIVYPGEEFSANAAMEPYDGAHGYVLGGSYENGTVVQTYGGGICQVSSTLYNAVLYAELEVTQRQCHSMLVNYVAPSRDAAIAGDVKDLKFKNNTDAPIYIEGYVSGGVVGFNIYGHETRDPSRSVEYESQTLSTNEPQKTFTASGAAFGSMSTVSTGHVGKKAVLWKVVYENGVEKSRTQINSSSYRSSPTTISVGISSVLEEANVALNSAIASNSEAAINQAIATWSGPIAEEEAKIAQQQAEEEAKKAEEEAKKAQENGENTENNQEGDNSNPDSGENNQQ
ncbi:G5 domain-containing protein [Acetitomaculum ruminis DSM 5522]|uniref:G5 domain-containing protein n=2 Tax=Acetitomaculum ruminis TaxID=2382 RepID=A0A1I0XFG9_9FIRM|nr:G5 domain-containing protein [Acetitomaculum ruminis DSM 5522]